MPTEERLFFTEEELIRELERRGLPAAQAKIALASFQKDGLWRTLRNPLYGGRYYWPAVQAFLDRQNGLSISPLSAPDGQENFHAEAGYRRRARTAV